MDPRERMTTALQALNLADEDEAQVFEGWLYSQPEGPAVALTVGVTADLSRLTGYAAGPPEEFVEGIATFLAAAGASEEELQTLGTAGAHLEPSAIGSFVEIDREGMDGGWFFPAVMPFSKSRAYPAQHAATAQLVEWARRCAAQTTAQLRRSVAEGEEITELFVPIPGADAKQDLELAAQALKMLGAPWFSAPVAAALADPAAGGRVLVVGLGPAGLARAGVLLTEPSPEAVRALTSAMPRQNAQGLAQLQQTLGVRGPDSIAALQLPGGLSVELYYSP